MIRIGLYVLPILTLAGDEIEK